MPFAFMTLRLKDLIPAAHVSRLVGRVTTIFRLVPSMLALSSFSATMTISSIAGELSTQAAVHALAVRLTQAGENAFNQTGEFPSPQILFGIGGTNAYGSCKSASGSSVIPGSFYCAKTNTIILEYQQLEELRSSFGDGAVVYALAHEYAHYVQRVLDIKSSVTVQELQADCMAGALLKATAVHLGLDQSDIKEIISTAAAIGGGSHGTPEQRAGAVMIGLKYGNYWACSTEKTNNSPSLPPSSNTSITTPTPRSVAIRPRQNSIPHPGGNATFIGLYFLINEMVPIYKDNILSPKQGGTMTTKIYNSYDGRWQSQVTYVDCGSSRFSFFPDLPSSRHSYPADAKMLAIAKCK